MVRLAYNILVRREPDEYVRSFHLERLVGGRETPFELIDSIRGSDEYRSRTPFGPTSLRDSLHFSRSEFVISLPPARRIIDLGGSHTRDPWGAMVLLGYPYPFDSLTIVDLPPEDRHPLYTSDRFGTVHTPKGPVRYEFRSMVDLSFADDSMIDVVYSGQSIEHITFDDADLVMREAYRVLRPGGYFAIDTPNAAVTRLQQEPFIDPDHKYEYRLEELTKKAASAGFNIHSVRGLNYAGECLARGHFDMAEAAANAGVYFEPEACYLLAVLLQKPS
jgi:SAM-dependent methyltransferase